LEVILGRSPVPSENVAPRYKESFRIVKANDRGFETRSFASSLAATHRGFTFYVADPISSIHGFHGWEL
jgi:hypothetical protein